MKWWLLISLLCQLLMIGMAIAAFLKGQNVIFILVYFSLNLAVLARLLYSKWS